MWELFVILHIIMEDLKNKRIGRIRSLLDGLNQKLEENSDVVAFFVYGSFSDKTDHEPTEYSDVDLEIVTTDKSYKEFIANFKTWFETNFETILIETHVAHLQKVLVTNDFITLEFHISHLSEFDEIDKRLINYFPNGYTLKFDKSNSLEDKIKKSIHPYQDKSLQQRLDELNSSFWFFIQGTSPYIERKEFWFGAAGYWAWLFGILCKVLRMYYDKEVAQNNPMKHIEQDLSEEIIQRIQPLRNLETPQDLKEKMKLLIEIYSEYVHKISQKENLTYDDHIENTVKKYVKQYLD